MTFARVSAPLIVVALVLTGCGTTTGTAFPAPLSSGSSAATVAGTSSAAVSSPPTPQSVARVAVSSTAIEDVFQCPTYWEMMDATGLDAALMSSSVVDGSKGCRYPIAVESRYTGAEIEIDSPYVEDGVQLSVTEARANLVGIRDSYVEPGNADSEGDVPFDMVDQPDLGAGAFSVPANGPDGHACGVFMPVAGDRTLFIYFYNGEEKEELRIPDPELACRAALAVAASLKE